MDPQEWLGLCRAMHSDFAKAGTNGLFSASINETGFVTYSHHHTSSIANHRPGARHSSQVRWSFSLHYCVSCPPDFFHELGLMCTSATAVAPSRPLVQLNERPAVNQVAS